jgi:hypothetical protein
LGTRVAGALTHYAARHAAPGRLGRRRDGRAVGVGSGRGALWQRFGEVGAARTAAARAAGGADSGAGGDVAVCEPARTGHSVSTVNRFRGAPWQASGEGRAWSTRGRSRAAGHSTGRCGGRRPGPRRDRGARSAGSGRRAGCGPAGYGASGNPPRRRGRVVRPSRTLGGITARVTQVGDGSRCRSTYTERREPSSWTC